MITFSSDEGFIVAEVEEKAFPLRFTIQTNTGPKTYKINLNHKKRYNGEKGEVKSVTLTTS